MRRNRGFATASLIASLMTLCLAAAPPVRAQGNSVANPGFDGSAAGWTLGAVGTYDPTLDAHGNGASGSARGSFDAKGPAAETVATQELPIDDSLLYHFGTA